MFSRSMLAALMNRLGIIWNSNRYGSNTQTCTFDLKPFRHWKLKKKILSVATAKRAHSHTHARKFTSRHVRTSSVTIEKKKIKMEKKRKDENR